MEFSVKRRRSTIWNSFTIINDSTATCNYCQHILSYKSSTSNLKKHLERKHTPTVKLSKQTIPLPTSAISESSEPITLLYVVSDEETERASFHVEDLDNLSRTALSDTKKPHQQEAFLIKVPDATDEHEQPLKERRSAMWNYFTPQNNFKAVCNLCQKHLSYKTSISNLKKHFDKKHSSLGFDKKHLTSNEMSENESYFNSSVGSSDSSSSSPTNSLQRTPKSLKAVPQSMQRHLKDEALIKMITVGLLPSSIVEDAGFQEYTRVLNPLYALPSKKKLSTQLVPSKFALISTKVSQVIDKVKSVTLTTDSWRSYNNRSFTRIIAHFINEDYKCDSVLLCVKPSTKSLKKLLDDVIEQWSLKEKVLLVISDNIEDAQDSDLQWPHLKCVANTINSIIQESLKHVDLLIHTVSSVVLFFKENAAANEKLIFFQKKNKKQPKRLAQYSTKQENSVFYMLRDVQKFKDEIMASLNFCNRDNSTLTITEENFKVIEELILLLEPLESIKKIVTKEMTLSLIIILCNGLIDHYNNLLMTKSFSVEVEGVVKCIVNNLNSTFTNLESIPELLVSTYLDPRFKHVGFSNESLADKAKLLVAEILNLSMEVKTDKSNVITPSKEQLLIWNSFDIKAANFDVSTNNGKSRGIIELERYLEEPLLNRNENPLLWWKTNAYNFPCLSELLHLKFGSVATATPCEMFCKNWQSVMRRRNSLPPNKIEQAMFIGYNFNVG